MWWCRWATYILHAASPVVWPRWPPRDAVNHLGTSLTGSAPWGRGFALFEPRGPRTYSSSGMDMDSPQTPNFSGLKDFPGIKFTNAPRVKLCSAKDELPTLREREEYRDSGIFFSSVDSTPEPREADANFVDICSDSTEGSESVLSTGDGKEVLCSPDLDFESESDPTWKMQSFFSPRKPDTLSLDSLSAGPPLLDLTMLMMQPVKSTLPPSEVQQVPTALPPDLLNADSNVDGEQKVEEGEEIVISTCALGEDISISSSSQKGHGSADSKLTNQDLLECEQVNDGENNVHGIDLLGDGFETAGKRKAKKRAKKRKSDSSSISSSVKKEKKAVPNYFVAVQITNPEIHTHVRAVQAHVEAVRPCLRAAFVPAETLHLTLHVSHLSDHDHISKAKAALDECHGQVKSIWPGAHAPLLHVAGMGSFKDNVIFVTIEKDSGLDVLNKVTDTVRACLMEKGIVSTDPRGFKPHITVMKLSKAPHLRHKGIKKVEPSLYQAFRDSDFGWQRVRGLQLCSMEKPKDGQGYYHVEHEVTFELPEGEPPDGSAGRSANFRPMHGAAPPVNAVVTLEKDLKWTFSVPHQEP